MNTLSKSERTRNFIIESTAEIFNKKGYIGTSLSDIIEATGFSKGCIYGNFQNKEEVALAAFDYNLAKIAQLVSRQMASACSSLDKLMVYVNIYDHYRIPPFPDGGCPIMNTAIESDDTNNILKDKAAKAIGKWEEQIVGIIFSGIAKGELKNTIEPLQYASSIIAMLEGGMMLSKATNNQTQLQRVKKTIRSLIENMMI